MSYSQEKLAAAIKIMREACDDAEESLTSDSLSEVAKTKQVLHEMIWGLANASTNIEVAIKNARPNCLEVSPMTADQLVVPGHYWWLPACSVSDSDKSEHWSIVTWHPADSSRRKSGLFVGPLPPPVFSPVRCERD